VSRVGPSASVDVLEPWIASRLRPLADYEAPTTETALDAILNPDWPRPAGPFTPAAVLVPLVERESGLNVILTRRADSLRNHSGQVALPGGRAEPGETPWETALREAQEEIGLDPSFVRVVGMGDRFEMVTGYAITPVVGFLKPGFLLSLQEAEVAEVFETPFEFLMDPVNHEVRERDFGDGLRRRYYAMSHEDRVIWGATAWILRALYLRVFDAQDAPNPRIPPPA
jgi:8-oxo-dGTP pyrophosphatase MutT (NUDIX family)